jgi:hypothetical protein
VLKTLARVLVSRYLLGMHNAEHIGSAGPANTNSGETPSVARHGSVLRYEHLECFGSVEIGLCALVSPKECVVVYGVNHNHVNGPQRVDRTFKIGDACTYGGRNIDYIGTVAAIGEKTVTVRDGSTVRRFTIGEFARLNKDFSLAKSEAHNAAWLD